MIDVLLKVLGVVVISSMAILTTSFLLYLVFIIFLEISNLLPQRMREKIVNRLKSLKYLFFIPLLFLPGCSALKLLGGGSDKANLVSRLIEEVDDLKDELGECSKKGFAKKLIKCENKALERELEWNKHKNKLKKKYGKRCG